MFNLHINFSYPWLLLLIVPAVVAALIPYFRISKRYRRTRNRITSLVLHIVVMVLCICVLSGLSFSYEIYNSENEILLVVDASYSTEEEKQLKDDYVNTFLNTVNYNAYKVGIITFGFDQQYPVPLSNDITSAYQDYLDSTQPDTSATDIAAALTYADSLFTNPEAAKIVLISDGIETDESALSVIKTISAKGIRIDTVRCSTLKPDEEVQIVGAELPEYNISIGEKFDIALSLQCNYSEQTMATIKIVDNDDYDNAVTTEMSLTSGLSTVNVEYSFEESGMHILNFIVETETDQVQNNNSYYSYLYLVPHDKILIIEYFEGDSEMLYELLKEQEYEPTVINVADEDFPTTLDELRAYDEIVLNNIAQSDLTSEFTKLLNEYVYTIGGGLFTVGGSEPGDITDAHAYDREDMAGSLLQQMLPVQAINYTPPLGLAIVIDVSGSMGGSKIDAAKNSAVSIVKDETCLSERDYVAVLTLADSYTEESKPIPMTRQDDILEAIYGVGGSGGTKFAPAIVRSSQDLLALYYAGTIQKMHVVIITDGGASDYEKYLEQVKYYYSLGVTFSFIAIEPKESDMENMKNAAKEGGGQAIKSTAGDLTIQLKDDLRVPEIKEVVYGEFTPVLNTNSSFGTVITQDEIPSLYGFYGAKARSSAEVVLSGEYGVPIYAQWKYGKGMVGSFMCDLKGDWSADFMTEDAGKKFISAIIDKLFPVGDIRTQDISVVLREENYITQVSIYPETELEEDETITMQVNNLTILNPELEVVAPSESDGYTRATIVAKDTGVYAITLQRMKGDVAVGDPVTVYKTFSYSAEYNMFYDGDVEELMLNIAVIGNGEACTIEDADVLNVFEGFVTSLQKNFDPRLILIITALVLFLLDIAVRKFKFKWPHEIVRDFKAKRNGK